jgi:hypothetical protein
MNGVMRCEGVLKIPFPREDDTEGRGDPEFSTELPKLRL